MPLTFSRQPPRCVDSLVFMYYASACESAAESFKNREAQPHSLLLNQNPQEVRIFRGDTGDCDVLWSLRNTDLLVGFSSSPVSQVLWAIELKL